MTKREERGPNGKEVTGKKYGGNGGERRTRGEEDADEGERRDRKERKLIHHD